MYGNFACYTIHPRLYVLLFDLKCYSYLFRRKANSERINKPTPKLTKYLRLTPATTIQHKTSPCFYTPNRTTHNIIIPNITDWIVIRQFEQTVPTRVVGQSSVPFITMTHRQRVKMKVILA